MVDLVIVPTSVVAAGNATTVDGLAGAAITAGQVVYKEVSTGLWKLADNNSATVEAKTPGGIALNGASTGQTIQVATSGDITIGATLVAGAPYYLSETPGGIQPQTDMITTGETVNLLGLAKSTTVLSMRMQTPGVTL
jgi:hypothetical protein